MTLTKSQVSDLARPFIGMVQVIKEFYQNPKNEEMYQKWYIEKFGKKPKDEVEK